MKPITKTMRAAHREQAEKRQAEYDTLTVQQKLDRLPSPPACQRQRTRLQQQLKAK